jgi:hypothetical protein
MLEGPVRIGQVFLWLWIKVAVLGEIVHEMDLPVHGLEAVMCHSVGNRQVLRL